MANAQQFHVTSSEALIRLGGLSVAQFAGISAALSEGHEASEVLALEGVEAEDWTAIERQWREAIVDSLELQLAFMHRRREAEEWMARSVAPLDEDPAAWAGLLGALSSAASVEAVLTPLGLNANDLNRLGRAWRNKQAADPALGAQLAAHAGAPPPAQLTLGPRVLQPFPWSVGATRAAAPAQGTWDTQGAAGSAALAPPAIALASFQRAAAQHDGLEATLGSLVDAGEVTLPPSGEGPISLPFGRERDSSDGAGLARAEPTPSPDPTPQSGETLVALPHLDDARELPFEAGALALTSLERYAALVAALRAAPERSEEVLRAAGLRTLDQRRRVHQLWATRFEANPTLRAAFERALKR